jgi:hypothetical protein
MFLGCGSQLPGEARCCAIGQTNFGLLDCGMVGIDADGAGDERPHIHLHVVGGEANITNYYLELL